MEVDWEDSKNYKFDEEKQRLYAEVTRRVARYNREAKRQQIERDQEELNERFGRIGPYRINT